MDRDSIDYRHVDTLFCAVEDQNQDVTIIANGIKAFTFKEDELMHGACVLYSKACTSFSIAPKCAELAKALADVTAVSNENPLQFKSFRDCIVQLAILEIRGIRESEKKFSSKQAGFVNFLVLLYKANMLSVVFVDYWLKSLELVKNSEAAKAFIKTIRNVKDKIENPQVIHRDLSQQPPTL